MATEPVHRRFTVNDYHPMAETGILPEDDRVELIDGEIIEMTPESRRRAWLIAHGHEIAREGEA